jgi:hypothetical protein
MKTKRSFLAIITLGLLLAGMASLSGCMVTNKVLELRKERETRTKAGINFWSLAAVRSAHTVPGGEVFVCAEFRDSQSDEPRAYTINLTQTSRIGKTYADLIPTGSARSDARGSQEAPVDMAWYLYPLAEARKGCSSADNQSDPAATALKVETVSIPCGDQSRLPSILRPAEAAPPNENRIVEVAFASPVQSDDREPDSRKASAAMALHQQAVRLVFLPAAGRGEAARPVGIAGAFEPGSEMVNPYTLLVAPAVAADAFIIMLYIMSGGC